MKAERNVRRLMTAEKIVSSFLYALRTCFIVCAFCYVGTACTSDSQMGTDEESAEEYDRALEEYIRAPQDRADDVNRLNEQRNQQLQDACDDTSP